MLDARNKRLSDLAREAGVSSATAFSLYHNLNTRIDLETLNKLCRYFNCAVGDILVYVPDDLANSTPTL